MTEKQRQYERNAASMVNLDQVENEDYLEEIRKAINAYDKKAREQGKPISRIDIEID